MPSPFEDFDKILRTWLVHGQTTQLSSYLSKISSCPDSKTSLIFNFQIAIQTYLQGFAQIFGFSFQKNHERFDPTITKAKIDADWVIEGGFRGNTLSQHSSQIQVR